jgi:hypothetical protein
METEGVIEMRDEMDSRLWIEHGQGWSDFVDSVLSGIGDVLRRIHATEFDAPWRSEPKQEH